MPLAGGTADLQVRAFADDEAWGERTLDLVERALPLLEDGDRPAVPARRTARRHRVGGHRRVRLRRGRRRPATEILVAFDQPEFTALHQVAHVWLSAELIESRWIREGMASDVAARVAAELDVPAALRPGRAGDGARRRRPSRSTPGRDSADPTAEGYGHAASWAFVAELRAAVGADAMRTVLARVAALDRPVRRRRHRADPPTDGGARRRRRSPAARSSITSRRSAGPISPSRFRERILTEADVALLERPRRGARRLRRAGRRRPTAGARRTRSARR